MRSAQIIDYLGISEDGAGAVKISALGQNGISANSQGVPMDDVRAHMWFNLVAMKGNAEDVKIRDIIANLLTPQQIAEAQKLARECQARDFKGC